MRSLATAVEERPLAAFRVGITGAARLAQDPRERLRQQMEELLTELREHIGRCARSTDARHVHCPRQPLLRVVSPLGEGADRVVAEAALRLQRFTPQAGCGISLEVLMPFDVDKYERTFAKDCPERQPASRAEFRSLLMGAGSRVLVLDGIANDDGTRRRSYGAVGQMVVRNSDVLIAVWDETMTPRGPGGTGDTVHYALRSGVPVWLVHPSGTQPARWLDDELDLLLPPPAGAAPPRKKLAAYVSAAIVPPSAPEDAYRTEWARFLDWMRIQAGVEIDPLRRYLAETATPNRRVWKAHSTLLGLLRRWGGLRDEKQSRRQEQAPAEAVRGQGAPLLRTWQHRRRHIQARSARLVNSIMGVWGRDKLRKASSVAALLSGIYQQRYRTSYLVVFVCAALALVCAALGIYRESLEEMTTELELFWLLIIGALVFLNSLLGWHQRYISYRTLGELLRLTPYLRALGWSLPNSRVRHLANSAGIDWVAWFFAASVRAEPLPTGTFHPEQLKAEKSRILERLLAGQIDFHRKRRKECEGAAAMLSSWGVLLFKLTLFLVCIKLVLLLNVDRATYGSSVSVLGLGGGVFLPAASAAVFGLRAYEELELIKDQSEQMEQALRTASSRISRIDEGQPLASQLLGAELQKAVSVILSDVGGWSQLFRLKIVEA